MRTPLMPAAVEMSPKAADRSRTERIDELAESPWSGVLSVTAPDDTLVAACSALGAARLIDLSGARLGVGDDMPAIAAGMVLIQTVVEGALDFAAGGEGHAALRPGHVVIRAAAVDAFLSARSAARLVTLAIPGFLLIPRFVAAGAIPAGGAIFHASQGGRLLHDLLLGLASGPPIQPGRVAPILDAAAALVGLCLAERPPTPVSLSALAAARADEIIRYLERNFANAALNPASMAEELGISVRYAHKLLEQTGRSFRQELVALRLEAARRAFRANAHPRRTIADIAISVGFNDLSQFNRHFRQAYAITPRAARQADELSTAAAQSADRPGRSVRRPRPAAAAPPSRPSPLP